MKNGLQYLLIIKIEIELFSSEFEEDDKYWIE